MFRSDDPMRLLMPWLDEEAADETGVGRKRERAAVERRELVEQLRGLADEEGEDVTMQRFLNVTGFKEYAVYKHFDSWAELRVEAGLEPRREANPVYTDEQLLAEAVRVIDECGGFPMIREFNQRSRYPYHALYMRFGRKEEIFRRCEEFSRRARQAQERSRPIEMAGSTTEARRHGE